MIEVSPLWKDIQQRFLLPETFVEIDCTISEVGTEEGATATGTNETAFSDAGITIGDTPKTVKYATNELNLWALDGSRSILPSSAPYGTSGYVSDIAATGSVTLSFPAVHTVSSSGLTITWSDLYGEYPTVFTVTAKNGDTVVAETTITDNTDKVSAVFLQLQNYDSITVTVQDWCLPHRRVRIEKVVIGHVLTLTKKDIISFKHEQHGDLLSGELPRYSIEFTLDNTDGRWNPMNPTGMEQYLSERQKLVVRYGMDVNGTTEWIKGGVFYLSEWDAPANGLEARFVARDIFEYMLNEKYTLNKGGTLTTTTPSLEEVILDVFKSVDLPVGFEYELAGTILNPLYAPSIDTNTEYSCAEVIQLCAHMGMCIIHQDRAGKLHIEDFIKPPQDYEIPYVIPASLSYSHPTVQLSKPLKSVAVSYGDNKTYVLDVGNSGETQTVANPFVGDLLYAEDIAAWVKYVLESRKTVSGEYRADPRLDVYDIVSVESKYGILSPVVITNITYTYNGSFHGSYTGRVLEV